MIDDIITGYSLEQIIDHKIVICIKKAQKNKTFFPKQKLEHMITKVPTKAVRNIKNFITSLATKF